MQDYHYKYRIPASAYNAFLEYLNSDPPPTPKLEKLLTEPTIWDDNYIPPNIVLGQE